MGRDLIDGSPAARALFDAADRVLGYSLTQLCLEGPEERLQQTENAQPALYTMSLACLEAAREQGSLRNADAGFVAGHSLGEYTALAAAGAFDFEDGLRLVQERGRLMHEAASKQPGAMAAILGLDEDTVRAICDETRAEVCNLNAPGQVVIGGTAQAVDGAMALAIERGASRGVRLKVSGAFHTSMMVPALGAMRAAVDATAFRDARVPVVVNTTASLLQSTADLRNELVDQLAKPVYWQRSVEFMRAQGVARFIEFGPGRVLSGLIRRIDRSAAVANVSDLAGARSLAAAPAPP
jgi:[acyl-carrier-protein] S-malonyltransferase